ncbi:MAG: 6-phosphofructokinase, partial [Clostridia bacterium]|nr:6-phosphofructokinase [Clostridia bacterium]
AAASLTKETDLVYLPEVPFSKEKFLNAVNEVLDRKKYCVVAVSEGIKYENGRYVGEDKSNSDVFGHTKLGGVCAVLKSAVTENCNSKCKAIELNILQRCAAHCASETDAEEAFYAGQSAVKFALNGENGKMVAFKRTGDYKIECVAVPLNEVANAEKKVPLSFIGKDGASMNEKFIDYALPLIKGENKVRYENGLPKFAELKRVPFKL